MFTKALQLSAYFLIPALILLGPVAAVPSEEPMRLEDLENELLEKNPEIQAARARAAAEGYRAGAVSGLDDPLFTYGYFGESIQTRVGPQKQIFQLSQKVPLGGQLSLKGDMAQQQAESLRATVLTVIWKAVTELRTAYYDLWWVEQALRITAEEEEVLKDLTTAGQAKYAAGEADLQDVLKGQLALSRLQDRRLLLQQRRQILAALINRLLDRAPTSSLGAPAEITAGRLPLSLDDLLEKAERENPRLGARAHLTEMAQTGLSLARRGYIPDITLGVQYFQIGDGETIGPDDGQDAWMVMAGINLPLWLGKKQSAVGEAAERLRTARDDFQREKAEVVFEVKDRYFKFISARDQLQLYRESIIPQSERVFQADRVAYETGKTDFLDLLESEKRLLEARLAYLQVVADTRKYLAELEATVGQPLLDNVTPKPRAPASPPE